MGACSSKRFSTSSNKPDFPPAPGLPSGDASNVSQLDERRDSGDTVDTTDTVSNVVPGRGDKSHRRLTVTEAGDSAATAELVAAAGKQQDESTGGGNAPHPPVEPLWTSKSPNFEDYIKSNLRPDAQGAAQTGDGTKRRSRIKHFADPAMELVNRKGGVFDIPIDRISDLVEESEASYLLFGCAADQMQRSFEVGVRWFWFAYVGCRTFGGLVEFSSFSSL